MNWTGGRLHRHSSAQHSKAQRIRKPKEKAQQEITLFQHLQPKHRSDPPHHNLTQDNNNNNNNNNNKQVQPLPTQNPPTNLATLKRKLLETPDWASISAARPAKITFTTAEELAQFGKRRKLTDADRARLNAPHTQSLRAPLFSRAEPATIENLEIRINGEKVAPALQHPRPVHQRSSQSMLLDRGNSICGEIPGISTVLGSEGLDLPTSELEGSGYYSRRSSLLSEPNIWIEQARAEF
ncbi:hypothetical protein BDV25DRAFT_140006 [Aspergillus avenaceus]|uniref:Uncharacterized protein n=1 Tax=Aspergillus avenaceus TaxID=36643 RepID=A0A5N6TVC5_ASPAV|nr:hypothetical protein BDV25DRAFT_140006 [Aspergillus avenaceus]